MAEKFNDKYLKVSEVAEILHVSRYTIYDLIKNGTLDAIKIGNKMLISVDTLQKYIDSCKIDPKTFNVADIEQDNQ